MFLSYDTIGYLKGPDIALVKDVETGTVAVRKKLRAELLGVYERLKSVEQANLPRVYETEEYEGECFAYYEYIEGETLEDIVHEGKYTIAQAEEWMEQLCAAFMQSEKLQAHARFLCSAGSLYLKRNGNLLFHGCVPCNRDGSFMEFEVGKAVTLSGKAYFDYADRLARQGLLAPEGSEEREEGRDYLWYLWCGRNSPVFGRDHIATFERALIEDKATWKEPKNHYYSYTDEEEFCRKILHSFGCDKPWSRIVNGHVPVKAKEGESPLKGHGRLVVIDGGFCRAYQSQTGIAGYTMFFNSLGMRLAAHEPFTSIEDAVKNGRDITSHTFNVDELSHRVMVADIDTGEEIQSRIDDLMKLLEAFRDGIIKVDQAKAKQR